MIGAGSFGTALAVLFARGGLRTTAGANRRAGDSPRVGALAREAATAAGELPLDDGYTRGNAPNSLATTPTASFGVSE